MLKNDRKNYIGMNILVFLKSWFDDEAKFFL